MMTWLIEHNMGILLILIPMVMVSWGLVKIEEKFKKFLKKVLTK